MSDLIQRPSNPLARVARLVPTGTATPLGLAARIGGAALAVVLATDEPYRRTRLFAAGLALLALATFLPLSRTLRGRLAWLGAGVFFFGGALLAGRTAGMLILLCGVVAALGVVVDEQHTGRRTDVPSFFIGFGLVSLLVAVLVLGVDG